MRLHHACPIALVAALALGQSCALTTDTIRIGYQPTKAAPIAGAEGVRVTVAMKDSRGLGPKVGVKKNGYGMEMAPILDPGALATLQSAIESELRGRGFAPGPETTVVVEVIHFYNDFKIGFFLGAAVAELNLSVQVKSGEAILFTRTIVAQGENRGLFFGGGVEAQVALEGALRAGMDQLFADQAFFDALIKSGRAPGAAAVL